MLELNKIHQGHALDLLSQMDDESIDCVITSPPYYGLRSYQTEPQVWINGISSCNTHEWNNESSCINCNAWKGELGLEPDIDLYLQHLLKIFDEIKRVLKKTGTCWVNLGDSYNGSGQDSGKQNRSTSQDIGKRPVGTAPIKGTYVKSVQRKSLLQIPSRFAIGMIDRGWILRNEIVWHKRNCMPTSAVDRFTVDYEKVYFFTKSPKYYFEQQFEPYTQSLNRWGGDNLSAKGKSIWNEGTGRELYRDRNMRPNPLGRNKRCVWNITTEPTAEAHFATFPQALVLHMIKAGCPEFICSNCGKAREKIYKGTSSQAFNIRVRDAKKKRIKHSDRKANKTEIENYSDNYGSGKELIGLSDCGCKLKFYAGVVLDPFMGSGTTAIVAKKLNRQFIGLELKSEYIDMAEKRFEKELGFFMDVSHV